MLTSYLPTVLSHYCQWEWAQVANHRVGVCVSETNGVWGPWVSWGDLRVMCLQQLKGGLLGRVCGAVSKICVLLMSSESPICWTAAPCLCLPPPVMIPYSLWSDIEMGLFGNILHDWGSWALTHMLSLFPHGRNHRLRRSLLTLSCAPLGEGWCG